MRAARPRASKPVRAVRSVLTLSVTARSILLAGFERRTPYREIARKLAAIGEPLDFRRVGELAARWRRDGERRRTFVERITDFLAAAGDSEMRENLLDALRAAGFQADLIQEAALAATGGRES